MTFPDHSALLDESYGPGIVQALIERAHWQTAKTVTVAAGQHEYVVRGWAKDDLSEREFDLLTAILKTHGRREEWVAPEGFYDSGKRPKYKNSYLYVVTEAGHHAYWFTWPRNRRSMLNREHVDIQRQTPTRRPIEAGAPNRRQKI
jgi:hypothetical protein